MWWPAFTGSSSASELYEVWLQIPLMMKTMIQVETLRYSS